MRLVLNWPCKARNSKRSLRVNKKREKEEAQTQSQLKKKTLFRTTHLGNERGILVSDSVPYGRCREGFNGARSHACHYWGWPRDSRSSHLEWDALPDWGGLGCHPFSVCTATALPTTQDCYAGC